MSVCATITTNGIAERAPIGINFLLSIQHNDKFAIISMQISFCVEAGGRVTDMIHRNQYVSDRCETFFFIFSGGDTILNCNLIHASDVYF